MKRQPVLFAALLIGVLIVILSGTLIHLLTESWWFDAVGFLNVFWTRLSWQVAVWVAVFLGYVLVLGGNYGLAMRLTRDRPFTLLERQGLSAYTGTLPHYVAVVVIGLVAFSAAGASTSLWETILKFLNPSSFDIRDPIFQNDVGFYVFRLPLLEALQEGLLTLALWGLVIATVVYSLKGVLTIDRGWRNLLVGPAKTHVSLLLVAIALLVALGFFLQRYDLLYSSDGVVFGAGYTDVHAQLQAYWVMSFVTLAIAVLFVAASWRRGFTLPAYGIGFYIVVLLLINNAYPWFQQSFIVEPNELEKETPYIAHNIEFTRTAYDLDQVEGQDFPGMGQITAQTLSENEGTIENIRLWDYRPLLSTYRQLQEIRLYYRFLDVDVDRYTLDGNYRQVMLAPRELVSEELPAEAQRWENQRLKYTHGYGLVMSPVNVVSPNGLPELFIQDIPPVSSVDLAVEEPAIYYGEATNTYIFTGTESQEFDYPQGDENAFTTYAGAGGVPMGSLWRRMVYASDLGSIKVLISNYFTDQSKIHYYRQVQQRVKHVAPFLRYDQDPYIAVIDGRIKWIVDAYTVSDRYPYSEPLSQSNNAGAVLGTGNVTPITAGEINYIRNSVKVVVDAFDGTLQFFVVDEDDPLLATYRQIFPDLFEPSDAIPDAVRAHFRYPLDLFKIQAQIFLSYHMNNPVVFYNQEDLWRFPTEVYEGAQQLMEPYYVIMSLPNEETEEFVLIMPFTPVNKDNMVAWMAARSDGTNYGNLLLYEFPKQELIYGPSQIEARVDQNPEISQQLTLWSQEGSRVIRGDLLVIPINDALLYVEPVYLRAEQGELPELRRVILAYEDRTVMEESLDQALAVLFGDRPSAPSPAPAGADQPAAAPPSVPGNFSSLVQSALDTYQQGQDALQEGDWQQYGESQRSLEQILQQLDQQASPPEETP